MAELSIQDAMKKFLKQSRMKSDIQSIQIEEVWEKIMGKTIAQYTDSIKIMGNKLFITTSVAPLKNELLFQKEMIRDRVNESMGEKVIYEVIIQ